MTFNPFNISKIPPIRPVGLFNPSRPKQPYSNAGNYNYYDKTNDNLYNICYMNASIQCLFRLDKFVQHILLTEGKNLVKASKDLIMEMINYQYNQGKVLSVKNIKECMGKLDDRFKLSNTEDVNDFISIYLDGLLEETMSGKYNSPKIFEIKNPIVDKAYTHFLNRFYAKKGNSFILDLFYGELKTTRFCPFCHSLYNIQFSAFNILELPIYELWKKNKNSVLNLEDILKLYISPNNNNEIICSSCQKSNLCSTTEIFKFPKYLLIYFGRTVGNEYISNDIYFKRQMDFNDFKSEKDALINLDNIYNLKSVIYYLNVGRKTGHYSALCFVDEKEYYFDDSEVIENPKGRILGNPILLFYENIKN